MKPYSERKVTIIGLGFLMEYIFPCFTKAMGANTAAQINAVTADAGDLAGKRQRLGIPVLLDDNAAALADMQPDMVFFAPPPSVARQVCEEALVPYYAALREKGKPLPQLVAFPPSPAGAWYQQQLGADLKVVNIIPNMKSRVGDEDVSAEACHLVTYPEADNWSTEEKAALESFLLPMGRSIVVPPTLILQVLSGEIGVHSLTEVADVAARVFSQNGVPCHYRQTAGVMRARHQQRQGYTAPGTNHCSRQDMADPAAIGMLENVVDTWYDSLLACLTGQGFPAQDSKSLLDPLVDLSLHEAQVESREQIEAKAKKDATRGGMRELAMHTYTAVTQPLLARYFATASAPLLRELARQIDETCHAVVERGRGLADAEASGFTPKQQAVMFALLAKNILESFGDEQGDALLLAAVERYGMQRGSRMAQRAAAHGKPLDMASYQAFTEWKYSGGFEKQGLFAAPYSAYRVTACPWQTAWEAAGFAQYASYYCRNVDVSILKGFNPALALEMPVYKGKDGSPHCEFHWKDFIPGPQHDAKKAAIDAEIQDSCVKDFVYHTAHTYATLVGCARQADAEKADAIALKTRREFAEACSSQAWLRVLALAGEDFDHA